MKNYLPIGSVVLLKGATKRVMIFGRIQVAEEDKVFDYSGCLFPEGYMGSDKIYLFNNEDIEMIYFLGMQDEEELKFRHYIEEQMNEQTKE